MTKNDDIHKMTAKQVIDRLVDKKVFLFSDVFFISKCPCGQDAYGVSLIVRKKNIIDIDIQIDYLCRDCFTKNVGFIRGLSR